MDARETTTRQVHDRWANAGALSATWPLSLANLKMGSGSSPGPIYEQICRALRAAIVAGDLPPGTLIPTSRSLARAIGVGRNTVVEACSRLVSEGYLVSNTRRGTRVAENPLGPTQIETPTNDADAPRNGVEVAFQAKRILGYPIVRGAGGKPFARPAPDPSLYPGYHLGRLLAKEFRCVLAGDPRHDSGHGCRRFQIAISTRLRRMAGISCKPAQIVPTAGLKNALDLAIRVLIDPGHSVYLEDPAPDCVHAAFRAAGARLYPMPTDGSGADASQVSGPPPRLIFVSPSVTFPFGRQMSERRRAELLGFAGKSGAMVFECDNLREFTYAGARLQAIHGLDRAGQVIYFGSLSEALGAHIEAGYLVVPVGLSAAFEGIAECGAHRPDAFVLGALADFIEDNHYAQHLRVIRSVYAERLRLMLEACRRHIPEAAAVEPVGGFHMVLAFRKSIDEERIASAAVGQGLPVAPLSRFFYAPAPSNGFVLGFAATPERLIDATVSQLAEIARRTAPRRS